MKINRRHLSIQARNIEGLKAIRSILDSWALPEEEEEMDCSS